MLHCRMVCEAILYCERLNFENEIFFVSSFQLIRRIISLVDYKGVRDCLKIIIEKILIIPQNMNVSIYPQLDIMYQVILIR